MDLRVRNLEQTRQEVLTHLDRTSFYVNQQLNESWEIGFTIYQTLKNQTGYDLVEYENSVFWVGQEFIIKELNERAVGQQLEKTVVAVHVSFTMQDGYQYDQMTGTFSIVQCLNHIFAPDHRGFTFRVIDHDGVISRQEFENFGDGNYLRLIHQIIDRFDVVMVADNKQLTFYPSSYFGEKTHEVIRYKHNTDDVKFEINTYNLRTQIMGFGKRHESEGDTLGDYYFQPLTYTSPEINKWGLRIAQPVRDERYTIPGNMASRLRQELQDYPEIVGVVSLSLLVEVKLGDYIRFVYEPLNVNQFIQVKGIKSYPMMGAKPPELNLNNTRQTMTQYMVALADRR